MCNQFQYEYLENGQVKKDICDYAENFFFEPFILELELSDDIANSFDDKLINDNLLSAIYSDDPETKFKFHKVTNINNIIGETIGSPIHISNIN